MGRSGPGPEKQHYEAQTSRQDRKQSRPVVISTVISPHQACGVPFPHIRHAGYLSNVGIDMSTPYIEPRSPFLTIQMCAAKWKSYKTIELEGQDHLGHQRSAVCQRSPNAPRKLHRLPQPRNVTQQNIVQYSRVHSGVALHLYHAQNQNTARQQRSASASRVLHEIIGTCIECFLVSVRRQISQDRGNDD